MIQGQCISCFKLLFCSILSFSETQNSLENKSDFYDIGSLFQSKFAVSPKQARFSPLIFSISFYQIMAHYFSHSLNRSK